MRRKLPGRRTNFYANACWPSNVGFCCERSKQPRRRAAATAVTRVRQPQAMLYNSLARGRPHGDAHAKARQKVHERNNAEQVNPSPHEVADARLLTRGC
jgi:hypothetical protein